MRKLFRKISGVFHSPIRSYLIIALALVALGLSRIFPALFVHDGGAMLLFVVALIGAVPVFGAALRAGLERRITIETFNAFALIASLVAREYVSGVFIVLMLASADILDDYTTRRSHRAIEELLKLKPERATVERGEKLVEIAADEVHSGDIVLVRQGERVPVDGIVASGEAELNEAPVTGESALISKMVGDTVVSGTLLESGTLKVRATAVGKDSTIERMAALIRDASAHRSPSERLADRFATIFLPVVALIGLGVFLITKNVTMVVALFLVACADDMAVAIPLAMTAAIGQAARRGVIVKGGAALSAAGRITTIVLDKTGTLTYGKQTVASVEYAPDIDETGFWRLVGSAEKFSEQPMGRALFAEALRRIDGSDAAAKIVDPDHCQITKGAGITAMCKGRTVQIGTESFLREAGVTIPGLSDQESGSAVFVSIDGRYAGQVQIADTPRIEAAGSMKRLTEIGVRRIIMLTGDAEKVAARIAAEFGITDYRARLKPEDKLRAVEALMRADGKEVIAVVGDGVNDAPALARADVGIAMGSGMATSVETADIVILTDDLERLPELILLGRRTRQVINGDMAIWFITNLIGFILVFTGFLGPALAAFYNFATDFLPLINSARLFRRVQ